MRHVGPVRAQIGIRTVGSGGGGEPATWRYRQSIFDIYLGRLLAWAEIFLWENYIDCDDKKFIPINVLPLEIFVTFLINKFNLNYDKI